VPHTPRFRALALFGRRLSERGDGLGMPASENLHIEPASAGGAGGDRRAYGSENLSPMPQKDFCNTIEGITDIETLVA